MRINKLKNYIGLCAVEGCRHRFEVQIEIKEKTQDGRELLKREFLICNEHSWSLLDFEED